MVGGLSLFIYFLCVLQTNNGLEERCLRKEEKDFQEYKQNIPELRDIDFQDHGFSTRHLSIISMEADPSSQLMGWIIHTLVTEYLNYPDAQHLVSQKADLFNNVPSKELSISTNLWHSSTSINSLPPNAEVVQPAFLTGRFNFFLPSWILQRSKFKVSDLTINCSLPLHHHPLSTFFDHSQLHTAVLEFLKSKNTAFSNLSALQGFHSFDRWAVYRSQGCLSDLHACVVIVASNYQSYGKCLVEMVERTHSKVVVFWLGHQWMHQFVMGRNSGRKSVFYFGSNLDTLYTSGLFEHLPVQQWSCLSGECTWSYHPIHNALTRDLVNSAYLIDNLMRRIKMSQEHMDHMLNHNYWSRGAKQVACDWLKENREVWSSWLKEAPNKQPVPIMIFYPLEHALPILLMATMAVRRINANSSILPNHHLILLDSQIGALSSPSQYKYVIESLSSGQVKAAFGSIRQSLSRLPDLMDAYKTIFFSFSSPVDFLDTGHTDTYFTMVPDLQGRFAALGSLFKEMSWSRASFIVEEQSTLYKALAKHMRGVFKAKKMKVMEEVTMKKDNPDAFFKALDDIKTVRSNIIILLISHRLLDRVFCILHHKEMTPQKGYVFIYVTGLNPDFIGYLYTNGGNRAHNQTGSLKQEHLECSAGIIKHLVDKIISVELPSISENLETLVMNQPSWRWYEKINKLLGSKPMYLNLYHIFDSILAFSLSLDNYLKSNQPDLQTLQTERHMESFKDSMKGVSFNGLSGSVKFANMSRINKAIIYQYLDKLSVKVGAFMPKDNQAEEQLQLDKSLFKWSTPDGKMPSDLIALVEQEACNLQVVSDLFHVSCNQAIAIFSIFVTLLIILPILFIIIAFRKRFYGQTIVEPIISQRLREKWEMKRENIKINRVLGHGEFGTVFGGEVSTGGVGDKVVAVAIKILKSGTRSEDKLSFFVEADLMKDFEHENIMKLVGVCSIDEPPMVVMEFMMYGDLRTFLLSRRHRVSNRGGSVELGPQAITKMALDVAKGLEYLSRNFCVHRDLACRNILVHESGVVKISDFGLSQKIYDECYTKYVNDNKIPIRWMAPECLNHGVFSFASDIWSYGVLVYEIFTFGTIPYHNLSNEKVVHHIKEGGTIHIPQNCPEDLANMLKRCWAYEAEDRPSIQVLIDELTSKPLLLKPCLDLPIPQLDPKDASTSAKANFKNLFPRQWASRLSTSSTTGLLVRYRNTFARTGSVQSPDRSPDAAHRVSEERFFNYPSNVASRDVSTAVESRSEAGLDEAEERFLLKRIGVKRAFVRSVSSEHKTPRFKVFKRKKASSELFREKP